MKFAKTVLVVDDTALNIALLTSILRNDYAVKFAKSGERAMEIVATDQPDLILLDVVMPGMSGLEVCRRLKASESTRHIPVIFISALASDADRTAGLSLGALGYLTKPFEVEGVLSAVDAALGSPPSV
jgi:CheY-like chemotaxis protein